MRPRVASRFILLAFVAPACGGDETEPDIRAGGLPTPDADATVGSATGVERYLRDAADRSVAASAMRHRLAMR